MLKVYCEKKDYLLGLHNRKVVNKKQKGCGLKLSFPGLCLPTFPLGALFSS